MRTVRRTVMGVMDGQERSWTVRRGHWGGSRLAFRALLWCYFGPRDGTSNSATAKGIASSRVAPCSR